MFGALPTRRTVLVGTVLATVGGLAACSSGDDSSDSATDADADAGSSTTAGTGERIVVIGEEYLLADLLELGIVPVASTATVPDAGFQGLGDHDTSSIRALPGTEANLELLASLDPDRIITFDFFADELGGTDTLESMARVDLIPDGIGPADLVTTYGRMFGKEKEAAALVAELEESEERAAAALGGKQVSVVAIYAGPSIAAFVAGPWAVPQTLLDAGATLVPSPAQAPPDRNGRAYLSMEQIELLSAPQMITQQSPLVDGESQAVEQVEQSPLWQSLPAVTADEVHELDRLAYPGIRGRIRLIDDLIAALG